MNDIIDIGKIILNAGATATLIGFLVVLAVPSLKKKVFGNGNGNEDQLKLVNNRLDLFEGNHLHTLEEMIKSIKEDNANFKKVMEDHNRAEIGILDKILIMLEMKN